MRGLISNQFIKTLKPRDKEYDVRDSRLSGFLVRVNPSGRMSYVCEYKRGRRINLGRVGVLTSAQARELAKEVLGNAVQGIYPEKKSSITFKVFIEKEYKPWVLMHQKLGDNNIKAIRRNFFDILGNQSLNEIELRVVDRWRTRRLNEGRKSGTVNRAATRLKAALTKAVEWGFLGSNPLKNLKALPEDSVGKLRYLTRQEEKRLRDTLNKRELEGCLRRDRANQWRKDRNYEVMPDLREQAFFDYIKPMVLLSINTGLRRGELFNLQWTHIDLAKRLLTLSGGMTKNGKTRYLPLNCEAFKVLSQWSKHNKQLLVFPGKNGKPLNDIRKAWHHVLERAQIKDFRWHDLRHHFASKLVMSGVDLNTVRELLGHSDIKMTLRYAHLAPEHKAKAVELISWE